MNDTIENNELESSDKLVSFAYNEDKRSRFNRQYLIVLYLLLALFISSFLIEIEQTINLKGQIIPHSAIGKIKHETGGRVSDIYVKNYDYVKKGDVIISLDKDKFNTSLKNNISKLKVIDSEIVHDIAFLKNNLHDIVEESLIKEVENLINNIPATIDYSKKLVHTSKLISNHKDKLLQAQISKSYIEMKRLQDESEMLSDEIIKLGEQRDIFSKLLASKNVSKIRALDYEIKYIDAKRELSKTKANIEAKNKEISELENKRMVQKQDDVKEKYEELLELNKQKLDLISNITHLEETLSKHDIRAPISGIIQGIDILKDSSIQPGEQVAAIIPDDADVIFEAKATLAQKAKINYKSKAQVQFDGFNAIQFDRVSGKITNISPYTFDVNPMHEEFTKIIVKLDKNKIESSKYQYPIRLGISGTLFVSAETQTLFAYIFGPIYNAFANAHGQEA